jgi:N-dimethylarginine dimethylaminohydrolase
MVYVAVGWSESSYSISFLPNWYLHIQGGFNILKKGIILPVASPKR